MGQKLESIPKMTKKGGIVKSKLELDQLFRLAHHISDVSDNIHILYSKSMSHHRTTGIEMHF